MNASASPRKRRKKPARKAGLFSWRYLLPAGFFVVLAVFLLLGLGRNPSEIPSPLIGKEAPAFELPRLAGVAAPDTSSISSASLRGKPYLLNVWASWCMPCLQEHPQMMALAQRHRIRMVGMNYKDRPEDARRWLARNGNPFDEIMVDAQGRTAIDFGVYGVPETFLIDGEGRIRRKIVGAISIETLQNELLPAIEKLEAEAK